MPIRKPTEEEVRQLGKRIYDERVEVQGREEAFVVEGTLSAKQKQLQELDIAQKFNALTLAMYDKKTVT